MEKIGLNDLRKMFLEFYKGKDHYARKSFSLIPEKDKSLLIINSGMAPLKPYFAGLETPPSKRMTTCQKCIRTGDIENVGYTSRHGTFFEMLGNFSFGDYFKEESLTWGWEFITKVLKMPEDKLWASVYEEDKEAYDIMEKTSWACRRKGSSLWGKKIIFGKSARVPADLVPRYISTAARNTAAENNHAPWAATATAMWNSGTTYLLSSTGTKRGTIRPLRILTSIPEWALSGWPASCRTWTPFLTWIPYNIS